MNCVRRVMLLLRTHQKIQMRSLRLLNLQFRWQKVVCGLHTIHGRDNNKQTAKGFLGYCFSSTVFHYQIRRIAQGTKNNSINTRNFSEAFVGLPSKSEQHKIATLLKLIDERISTQNKIIEDLKKLKSAIAETLFCTPKNQCLLKGYHHTARSGNWLNFLIYAKGFKLKI